MPKIDWYDDIAAGRAIPDGQAIYVKTLRDEIERLRIALAAARDELREAADKFHILYCDLPSVHPDKPYCKQFVWRAADAAAAADLALKAP